MHRWQPQIRQEHIDEAVLFQDSLPGHGSEQRIHPEGQQEQQEHQHPLFIPLRLQYQAERIGQQKADEGADEGQLHGKAQRPQVLALEHRDQVGKGNIPRLVGQSCAQHEKQGQHDKEHGPEGERQGQEAVAGNLCRDALIHR